MSRPRLFAVYQLKGRDQLLLVPRSSWIRQYFPHRFILPRRKPCCY